VKVPISAKLNILLKSKKPPPLRLRQNCNVFGGATGRVAAGATQ
jgi:hypothetical protein